MFLVGKHSEYTHNFRLPQGNFPSSYKPGLLNPALLPLKEGWD